MLSQVSVWSCVARLPWAWGFAAAAACSLVQSPGGSTKVAEGPVVPSTTPSSAAPPSATPTAASSPPSIETCAEPCTGCTTLVDPVKGNLKGHDRSLGKEELDELIAFNRDYLSSEACKAERERLGADGMPGDGSSEKFVVDGAFTEPLAKQTLVSFFVGSCGMRASHSENWGTTFALIIEGGKIISVSTEGPTLGYELLAIDFNRDGLSEVVEYTGDYAAGANFSAARIWSYRGGHAHTWKTFDLSNQNCIVPDGENYESALLVRWEPSRNVLCFLTRRRNLPCR